MNHGPPGSVRLENGNINLLAIGPATSGLGIISAIDLHAGASPLTANA